MATVWRPARESDALAFHLGIKAQPGYEDVTRDTMAERLRDQIRDDWRPEIGSVGGRPPGRIFWGWRRRSTRRRSVPVIVEFGKIGLTWAAALDAWEPRLVAIGKRIERSRWISLVYQRTNKGTSAPRSVRDRHQAVLNLITLDRIHEPPASAREGMDLVWAEFDLTRSPRWKR